MRDTSGAAEKGGTLIIASPVRQTPEILRTFLESLVRLDVGAFDIEYLFIDDNEVPESTALLQEFVGRVAGRVTVRKATTPSERYIKDDKTHRWTEGLMWRVARFKDAIIEFALGGQSSHLLLVDSDLVLHPLTLRQLVALGLPIVSEIFWTKWNPDGPEYPQVWAGGQYRLYRRAPGESLSDEDVARRTSDFLASLRRPGVYQVGGLGALTLFSREALLRGVRFAPIPNLDLVGEDRHLCVRAAALGIPLYVDTHYPALHLYRQADLERVDEYTSTAQKEVKIIQMVENAVEALFTDGSEVEPGYRPSRCSVQPARILERIRRELRVDGPNGMSLSEVTVYNGLVQFVGHQRCTTYFHLRVTPRQGGPTYNFRGTAHFETDARKAWRLAELQLEESEPIQPVVLL
ncbi:MAG: hypothetical protein BAA01_16895 [Bacillus thermozeamaize]|uniref:Uncharacterized protein n=1 Tax=Bacillus thermozeamaize TaxID=230954 RepID=A0A1Y3PR58_9BACI|nr:MAG: hypothetical protein BAA01_16895 [Bacillus thermozeamaize]